MLVAVPAVIIGLSLSEVRPLEPVEYGLFFGDSLLFSFLTRAVLGVASDEVTITGEPLPRFGNSPDPAVGLVAPTVSGVSFDGSPVTIEPSDKFTVIMFLAHWCPHCQTEIDDLGPYLAETPLPDNVEVVSVSTGVDANRPCTFSR